jgi:hypothetical protein
MNYRYTDGTPVRPGDKAAWRDAAGVVVFSRGAGFEGLLLKTAAEILPVSESELKWLLHASEPHYLTGEEMMEGDVVEVDAGCTAYPARLHLFRGRSRFEFWEPGEVLFLGASSGLPFKNAHGTLIIEVTFRFAVRANRKMLRDAMMAEGFAPYDGEWWHFCYGDKEWAFYYKKDKALYNQVYSFEDLDIEKTAE